MGDIVCKFGGTSLADAVMFRKVRDIILRDPKRRFVVVSAPGLRNRGDRKITDLLYLAHDTATNELPFKHILDMVFGRFREIVRALGLNLDLEPEYQEISSTLARRSRDYAASRGEYLQGRIMAAFLGAKFVDPVDCIFFRETGLLDSDRTYPAIAKTLAGPGLFVIPGFYGASPEGGIKTFSRGGSDISGAVVARGVSASTYENWTDVSGLLMADPTVVENPKPMPEVTYTELRELSYMGAQVLHDEAIFPVREAKIPVVIRNTNRPDDSGTMILSERDARGKAVVGIAGKKGFDAVYMSKALLNKEVGFGRKLLGIFESHGISFEHLPSGIDSLSVVVSHDRLQAKKEQVLEDIRNQLKVEELRVYENIALVAVVGSGMAHHAGIAARLFTALSAKKINVQMIDQGASELTIIIGVSNDDFSAAITAIYRAFEAD